MPRTTERRVMVKRPRPLGDAGRGRADGAHLVDDPLVGTLADEIGGDGDRRREAERVGAAMALHHDAVQPEEHRAVVAARVEPLAQHANAGRASR